MKKLVLMLGVLLISSSAFGYTAGSQSCSDFEEIERDYIGQLNYESVGLLYGHCLLIKGSATNNPQDTAKGLHILHDLKDKPNSAIPASYFLAMYHETGGTFKYVADHNLDLATHHYSHTLAVIKTYNFYPFSLISKLWELDYNIEMTSYYRLPQVYVRMFYLGAIGDYNLRLINSPSYEGDRDLKTYPDYRQGMMGYIDLAIEHAGICKNLPLKKHFEEIAPYYIEICGMYEEKAKLLKDNQWKRHVILSQDRCQDIGSAELKQANCPEIDELDEEFMDIIKTIAEEKKRILDHVRHHLASL